MQSRREIQLSTAAPSKYYKYDPSDWTQIVTGLSISYKTIYILTHDTARGARFLARFLPGVLKCT
ncbi:MAG: hypothetical protein ABJQ38_05805 [Flavobacteriaceae bacterium]